MFRPERKFRPSRWQRLTLAPLTRRLLEVSRELSALEERQRPVRRHPRVPGMVAGDEAWTGEEV
jgi:hypothetical protein